MPNLIQARRVLMRSTAAAASSTWSPTDLGSALVAGYTTLRAGTVHTSGGNITTWDDFSGNSRTLTSAVGNEPAYSATGFNGSQPGITFDPTNNERMVSGTDAIDLGTGAASAFFMSIILRNTTESYGRILGFVFASGDDIGTPSFSIVRDDTNDVFELYSNGPVCTFSATYDTPIRLALVADGANARFYINNAAQSSVAFSATLGPIGTLNVGRGDGKDLGADLQALAIMNRNPTSDERASFDTWLQNPV